MCGIFGYVGDRLDASELVLNGLKRLEYRGYDSWGVIARNQEGQIEVHKEPGKIGQAKLNGFHQSSYALGHTRWATHGGVIKENAHPHLDCHQTVAIAHNGIVENYQALKERLLERGHRFSSQTDSEVVAHLIEEKMAHQSFSAAVTQTFNQLEGLNAIIAMDLMSKTFSAIRLGSPLVVGKAKSGYYLSSDPAALLKHTKKVYFLRDYDQITVNSSQVILINLQSLKQPKLEFEILDWKAEAASKGKYKHFMLKEIEEQPKLIERIADSQDHLPMVAAIQKSFGTYLVGCGTASHACLAGSYLFSNIAGKHINWAVGSEFGYQLDFLTDKSLVIALSQSGETADTLEAVRKSREQGTDIGALVNVKGSTLEREADVALMLSAGPEKAVASTKAYITKLSWLLKIAHALNQTEAMGNNELKKVAESMHQIIAPAYQKKIQQLSHQLKDHRHIYIVGRGTAYPTALETALKIKEISYIHAEGFAAGELKHGVIALIEEGTPCLVFAPDDDTYGDNLSAAMEMKARGGHIIGVSFTPHEIFDDYLEFKSAGTASILPQTVIGQLLAYYLSVEKDLDPDMPRNLAKSVTVK